MWTAAGRVRQSWGERRHQSISASTGSMVNREARLHLPKLSAHQKWWEFVLSCTVFIRTTSAHGHFPVYSPTLVVIVYGDTKTPETFNNQVASLFRHIAQFGKALDLVMNPMGWEGFGGLSPELKHCYLVIAFQEVRGRKWLIVRAKLPSICTLCFFLEHGLSFTWSQTGFTLPHLKDSTGFTFLRVSALHNGHFTWQFDLSISGQWLAPEISTTQHSTGTTFCCSGCLLRHFRWMRHVLDWFRRCEYRIIVVVL